MQKINYRFTDGPRLNPEFSGLLRSGKLSPLHGCSSHRIPIDRRGAWSATTCDFCEAIVASAYLADQTQFFVDLVLGEDREVYAELARPHRCDEIRGR